MNWIRKVTALWLALILSATGAAHAVTLATGNVENNGNVGIMFDVSATNGVTVRGLAVDVDALGGGTYEIYGKPGTHVGSENNAGDWTLLATTSTVGVTDGIEQLDAVLNVGIPAGQTYSFFIWGTTNSVDYMTSLSALGAVQSSDANINIHVGSGRGGLFVGGSNVPREFVGEIHYDLLAVVPTLSEWAMIVLGLMIVGVGMVALNRRRAAI